jgi:hypothetical protein
MSRLKGRLLFISGDGSRFLFRLLPFPVVVEGMSSGIRRLLIAAAVGGGGGAEANR